MDQVTQQNAGNAEETAAASQELNAQATVLSRAVTDLHALMGNQRRQTPVQTPNLARAKSGAPARRTSVPLQSSPAAMRSDGVTLRQPELHRHATRVNGAAPTDTASNGHEHDGFFRNT